MENSYFYLDKETLLDKQKTSHPKEFYAAGKQKTLRATEYQKFPFFLVAYDKGLFLDAHIIFRTRTEREQVDIEKFIETHMYDKIYTHIIPDVTFDEMDVLVETPDSRYNDATRIAKISTIEDARTYIKEEAILAKQLQSIMSDHWQERILSEVQSDLQKIENLQDAQALLDTYTAQRDLYHFMIVPSFWEKWASPYCSFFEDAIFPEIQKRMDEIKQSQAISDAGADGERRTAYALKWLSAAGYRGIEKDCTNKYGSGRLILQNFDFIDEPQEYDNIVIGHNGVFCIETKNYGGELQIDLSGDWLRLDGSHTHGIQNPVFQCDRHHALLQSILGSGIKIIDIICIANDQVIIHGRGNCPVSIVKYDQLSRYIQNYASSEELDDQEIKTIIEKIEEHKNK